MPEEFYAIDYGTWRKATGVHGSDHGTWRTSKELWWSEYGTWKRTYNSVTPPSLNSASGAIVSAFAWDLSFTLSGAAPMGYSLSVISDPGGLEAGPFDISGITSTTFTVTTNSALSYYVQLLDDLGTPLGSAIYVTPV